MMKRKPVELGRIEFHTPRNEGLIEDFFKVIKGDEGWIVDVFLMDIQTVLKRHGYDMQIFKVTK